RLVIPCCASLDALVAVASGLAAPAQKAQVLLVRSDFAHRLAADARLSGAGICRRVDLFSAVRYAGRAPVVRDHVILGPNGNMHGEGAAGVERTRRRSR